MQQAQGRGFLHDQYDTRMELEVVQQVYLTSLPPSVSLALVVSSVPTRLQFFVPFSGNSAPFGLISRDSSTHQGKQPRERTGAIRSPHTRDAREMLARMPPLRLLPQRRCELTTVGQCEVAYADGREHTERSVHTEGDSVHGGMRRERQRPEKTLAHWGWGPLRQATPL